MSRPSTSFPFLRSYACMNVSAYQVISERLLLLFCFFLYLPFLFLAPFLSRPLFMRMRVGWCSLSPVNSKWVWEVEPRRLHAIDFFMYRNGLFSRTSAEGGRDNNNNSGGGGSGVCGGRRKRNVERLDALSGRSRAAAPKVSVSPPNSDEACAARPFSPIKLMQRMMQEWEKEQQRVLLQEEEALAKEEAEAALVMEHPSEIFGDEAAVLRNFGMGAFVSREGAPGFSGLFRQHWKDFLVTEMVHDGDGDGEVGKPLSREPDWTIPPLPSELWPVEVPNVSDTCEAVGCRGCGGSPQSAFFTVNVEEQLGQIVREDCSDMTKAVGSDVKGKSLQTVAGGCGGCDTGEKKQLPCDQPGGPENSTFYLQCFLRKQHIAHSVALSNVAQTLRMHPSRISVAGIKDYIGDTIQRVRLQNITPASALQANRVFRRRRWKMTLSNFSYHTEPLFPGRLFGNHFKIILRDVTAPRACVQDAVEALQAYGFPNYYGCQRFSWFGGKDDAAFAILNHNWLVFAFRFLGYSTRELTLRELLQRERKYPNPVQDQYRRDVVRRLRAIAVEPDELDTAPFLSCPSLGTPLTTADGGPIGNKHEMIIQQLKGAYFDLNVMSRRMTAQRLCSYLWNQVLTLRLHHFGGKEALEGDMVLPEALRNMDASAEARKALYQEGIRFIVGEEEKRRTPVTDVVHPGFSFNAVQLPRNVVGDYFLQVCDKYHLDWFGRHSKSGIHDFLEPPRPIVRKPMNLSYEYDVGASKLTLEFSLERGSYANVLLTELMKQVRCVGSDDVLTLPLPEAMWELGGRDPGYVTSMQDIYKGFQDGLGFVSDEHVLPLAEDVKPWDYTTGPLFLPEYADPVRKAYRWGSRHLLRNTARRERDEEMMKLRLFEKPLAKTLSDGEVSQYAGHTVPMAPNSKGKKIFFKVLRRQRRYPGAPKSSPRVARGAHVPRKAAAQVPFKTINKNTWNVTW
uniref:Uncharacterized protein TCIL3000_11_9730 n=1 Tax=Trypanosoma congolense (strain IL3000) TaxID=1068625 RepID=G0V1I5_TRYCI|nr:unnamed protein product [Trypanosoma congolense IL3000]